MVIVEFGERTKAGDCDRVFYLDPLGKRFPTTFGIELELRAKVPTGAGLI